MEISFRVFAGAAKDFALCQTIRQKVFVEEQKVPPELEYDEHDLEATHLLLYVDGQAAGTARFHGEPQQPGAIRAGRIAILREYRGLHLGQALVERMLAEIQADARVRQIVIHAQDAVVDFYARFGFKRSSEGFYEANILHYCMILDLAS